MNQSQLVKIVALTITKLICAPLDMSMWLKFDSDYAAVNSSGTNRTLFCEGKPKKLPPGFGIFRNWGAYFSGEDCVRIAGGLVMSELQNTASLTELESETSSARSEWSLSFWTILPLDPIKAKKKRVLVQSNDGDATYLMIENDFVGLELRTDAKHRAKRLGIMIPQKIQKLAPDWHHIAVVCQNRNDQLNVKFYFDGQAPEQDEMNINSTKPVGYIGNSKYGDCPFGSVADFRIYPYAVSSKDVEDIHALRTDPKWERLLPDRHI